MTRRFSWPKTANASLGSVGIERTTFPGSSFIQRIVGRELLEHCNMPLRGLAKASTHVNATGAARSAAGRLGRTDGSDAPAAAE
jgi:hypothetical protein